MLPNREWLLRSYVLHREYFLILSLFIILNRVSFSTGCLKESVNLAGEWSTSVV